MKPQEVAKVIDEVLGTRYEAVFSKYGVERQITGEKKWQVTIEWVDGTTTRVVID